MKCPECGQERFDHDEFMRWINARLTTIRLLRESYQEARV